MITFEVDLCESVAIIEISDPFSATEELLVLKDTVGGLRLS